MQRPRVSSGILRAYLLGSGVLALIALIWIFRTGVLEGSHDVTVVIPPGTAARLDAGDTNAGIPERIELTQGDRLVLKNEDVAPHLVGGLFVFDGSTVTAPFREVGTFNYVCSVHPNGRTVFEVAPKAQLQTLVWTELGLSGALVLIIGFAFGNFVTRRGISALALGGAATLAGLVMTFNSSGLFASEGGSQENESAPVADPLASGKVSYLRFCDVCHGSTGFGDGPLATSIDPPPGNLIDRVPIQSDVALFQSISEGIPGTSMPGSGDVLSGDEITDLIAYIRTLK